MHCGTRSGMRPHILRRPDLSRQLTGLGVALLAPVQRSWRLMGMAVDSDRSSIVSSEWLFASHGYRTILMSAGPPWVSARSPAWG